MPRKATGNIYFSAGRWYARVKIGAKERPNFQLPTCTSEEQADARREVLATLAVKLRATDTVTVDVARGLLQRAAEADAKGLEVVSRAVDAVCSGAAQRKPPDAPSDAITFQKFGEMWTSGELARLYPDHVRTKRSVEDDVYRLERHVYPIVGPVALASFSLADAQAVMRSLPPRSAATRRHVAQLMHRLLGIAVFPACIITAHPLPKGFLPKVGPSKAKGWLYPDEDARLLACTRIPLCWRVLYGYLHREGPRLSEAAALDIADVDLERGVNTLDKNKTDDPRAWVLSPGMASALRAWRALRGDPPRSAPLFVDEDGERIGEARHADRFREHLKLAGIDRPELFERSEARMWIRLHDTRATFITIALACGRSETWVADRSGHKSSAMINRYRRAARTAAELGLGDLAPMDEAIPELRGEPAGAKGGKGGDRAPSPPRSARPASRKPQRYRSSTEGGTRTHKPVRTADFEGAGAVASSPQPPEPADSQATHDDQADTTRGGSARSGPPSALSPERDEAAGPSTARSPRGADEHAHVDRPAPAVDVATTPPHEMLDGAEQAPVGPRAALLASLAEALRAAVALGDVATARALHATLGGALSSAAPEESGVKAIALDRARRGRAGR